ncbi:hypothetical protein, partial [Streptomyces sp. NPDC004976]
MTGFSLLDHGVAHPSVHRTVLRGPPWQHSSPWPRSSPRSAPCTAPASGAGQVNGGRTVLGGAGTGLAPAGPVRPVTEGGFS